MASGQTVIKVDNDDSKTVIESLIFTRSQSDGNIYRQRFLLRLVELAQGVIQGNMDTVLNKGKIDVSQFGIPYLDLPVKSILAGEEDKNYEKAKRAVLDYLDWRIIYEDEEKFKVSQILYEPELDKKNGRFQFYVNPNVWRCLVDFTKGYTQYNLNVALRLTKPLARSIYKGLENQKGPMTYTLDNFREIYGYGDKYKDRNSDFISKVVEPAQRELDEKSPWTFTFRLDTRRSKDQTSGRYHLSTITITPVHRLAAESVDTVRKMVHPADVIGSEPYRILTQKFFFTYDEVKTQVKLFEMAAKNLGENAFADWLDQIAPSASRAKTSVQGYVVNSLKGYLKHKFGIVYGRKHKEPHGGDGERPEAVSGPSTEAVDVSGAPAALPAPASPAQAPPPVAGGLFDGLGENQYQIGSIMERLLKG